MMNEIRVRSLCGNVCPRSTFRWHGVGLLIALFSLVFSISAPAFSQTNTITLFPVADAFVENGGNAGINFGQAVVLEVKNPGGNPKRVAYLKFDLSSISSPITNATIYLYGGNQSTAGYVGTDSFYSVADNTWGENTITWNNAPPIGTKIATTQITSATQYYAWNVTSYIQAQAVTPSLTSMELQMDLPSANGKIDTYSSRESANVPRLVITVTPGAGPTSLTATPGNNQVNLNWTALNNVTQYNIKRSSSASGPFTLVGQSSSNSYTDNSAINGNTYFYEVTGIVNGLETSPSPVASATLGVTIVLTSVADTYSQNGTSANSNYGSSTSIIVKNPGSNPLRIGYLKFDLSQITGTIQSATLQLYGGNNSTSGYSGSDSIYQTSTYDWLENTLTFNNAPTLGAKLATAPIVSGQQWNSWNLTSAVQAAVTSGIGVASYGLAMDLPSPNKQGDVFNSREAATNKPELVITQSPPPAPLNLVASATDSQVALTWSPIGTTGSYTVLRSTVSGGPYTQIGTALSTSYLDTAVTDGTTYYYVVTANTSGGVSTYSNQASATPTQVVLFSLVDDPDRVTAGQPTSVLVTLTGPAIGSGATIALTSDVAGATFPATVTVPAGQSTTTFTVNTSSALTAETVITFKAVLGAITKKFKLTIDPAQTPVNVQVNFQPQTSAIPTGFIADYGQPFDPTRGYGWFTLASLNTTHVPLDLTLNTRDRMRAGILPQLNTIIHMQFVSKNKMVGTSIPGGWDYVVPNGSYKVTVSVGDEPNGQGIYDSQHTINVNGTNVINLFQSTPAKEFDQASAIVNVTNGLITIDPTGGVNTKLDWVQIQSASLVQQPQIIATSPSNGDSGDFLDTAVTATVSYPTTGDQIDTSTLTPNNVTLVQTSTGTPISGQLNTSGGFDLIVFQPNSPLLPLTQYTFSVSSNVKDTAGNNFVPYTMSFTTGSSSSAKPDPNVSFYRSTVYTGGGPSDLHIGPDGLLYVTFINGDISRFTINPDGTLSNQQTFTGFEGRTLLGFTFDPNNPNLIWLANNGPLFPRPAPDFTGKITQLLLTGGTASFTGTMQDYIVGLPRSANDHMTDDVVFGPDGLLYATQGSNSGLGAPDSAWALRPERLLNASVLQINPNITTGLPINVQTEPYNGTTGSYDPTAPNAPVKLYATGLRNAFNLIWHSNGNLYCPTNGGSAGGNTPGSPAGVTPVIPALNDVGTQDDYLFKVVPGGYYGHPNTLRGQFVLNGGNPTAGVDPAEVVAYGPFAGYPVGTLPDPNYKGFNYDFGKDVSPDGTIEYMSNTFGGALQHKLIICRYSVGKDLISIGFDPNGNAIPSSVTQVYGGGGDHLIDPIDVAENLQNGNIYVAELDSSNGSGRLSVLRPAYPSIGVNPQSLLFDGVIGTPTASQTITITNYGHANLTIPTGGLTLTGIGHTEFVLTSAPTLPLTLAPGQTTAVAIALNAVVQGVKSTVLNIQSNDPATPNVIVRLQGIATPGVGGPNEPSLQRIFDAWGFGTNAGCPNPDISDMPGTFPLGDEIIVPEFVKASSGPVTILPLADFGPNDSASGLASAFGWYSPGTSKPSTLNELFTIANAYYQTLAPVTVGTTAFDPGTKAFSVYSRWPHYSNRIIYQQDFLNNYFGSTTLHHVRVYPAKNANGTIIPNSYLVAFEESASGFDYNDLVVEINNVNPVPGAISLTNLDGLPANNRYVFNRIGSLSSPPANAVHDTDTVQITNTGQGTLSINSLQISGPWILPNPPTLPLAIPAGGSQNITVKFVATSGRVTYGSLTINSNDPNNPSLVATLAGYWQSQSEFGQEPTPIEVIDGLFGFQSVIEYPGQNFNIRGQVIATGEEVLSPFWKRLDPTKPVTVRQLSADHTYPNAASIGWYPQGTTTVTKLFTMDGNCAQSLLPYELGTPNVTSYISFTPTSPTFGWRVDNREWSEDSRNSPQPGHHLRFVPVRDSNGNLVPGSYTMNMDYDGINFDYNDNIYLFTNVVPATSDPTPNVNPFVGTAVSQGGVGNAGGTFPGADTPFGMAQPSPNTVSPFGGGYSYNSSLIQGFSQTHLSGPGAPLAGDIAIMPTTGPIVTTPTGYESTFSHSDEFAIPGYYDVGLSTYGIQAELTATTHSAWHRFTFPATTQANVLFDLSSSYFGAVGGAVSIVDNQTVAGYVEARTFQGTTQYANAKPYYVYFYARFSVPFTTYGTWTGSITTPGSTTASGGNSGAYVTFDATQTPVVVVKVGLSYVSGTGAMNNLNAESSDFNFDQTRQNAHNAWQTILNRVQVSGGTPAQLTTFYSALYHTLLHPNVYSDADGSFTGFDNTTHTATYTTYSNFSLWDTYRTEAELLNLVAPERSHDMIESLMEIYNETGWLPRWVQNNVETNAISGDPVIPTIVDAYTKGIIPDLTPSVVYGALVHNATNVPPAGSQFEGRLGLASYIANGYVPYDPNASGVNSKLKIAGGTTEEYSIADGALSLMSQALGNTSDYTTFSGRATNYRTLIDVANECVHSKLAGGIPSSPFDPTAQDEGFKEGSPDQYTWMAYQDIYGLFTSLGGSTTVGTLLDNFFAYSQLQSGLQNTVLNVWGGGGNYDPYNEFDIHAPYLYIYDGQPAKTQFVVNAAETLYSPGPGGIPGNDDLGTLSAWYVLSALGLYPITPGKPLYLLTTPVFPQATISLQSPYYTATTLQINAPNVSSANPYIQSLTVNGTASNQAYIMHSAIVNGAVLNYTVGASPSATWGIGSSNLPPKK